MAANEKTSKRMAELAAELLKHPERATKKDIKSLAGAVMTQAPDKDKSKAKAKKK